MYRVTVSRLPPVGDLHKEYLVFTCKHVFFSSTWQTYDRTCTTAKDCIARHTLTSVLLVSQLLQKL